MRPVTEIDIVAVASVFYGIARIARGAYVANVTMLAVGGNFHLCIIITTLALTFVILVPTGQAVRLFSLVVFEKVSESLFDVSIHLCVVVATFAIAGGIASPIPVLGAGCVVRLVPLRVVSESGHALIIGVIVATFVGTLFVFLVAPPLASRLHARHGYG